MFCWLNAPTKTRLLCGRCYTGPILVAVTVWCGRDCPPTPPLQRGQRARLAWNRLVENRSDQPLVIHSVVAWLYDSSTWIVLHIVRSVDHQRRNIVLLILNMKQQSTCPNLHNKSLHHQTCDLHKFDEMIFYLCSGNEWINTIHLVFSIAFISPKTC